MSLSFIGLAPLSVVSAGVTLALPALSAEIGQLSADAARLGLAIPDQLQFQLTPPDPVSFAAGFTAALDPTALASALNPLNWAAANAGASLEAGIQLGIVEGLLAGLQPVQAILRGGLDAPGITGWSFAGSGAGFGQQLARQTRGGWAAVPREQPVGALILAASSFTTWQAVSRSFRTGPSAGVELPPMPLRDSLTFLGSAGGGSWATELARVTLPLDALALEWAALRASLQLQIQISLGLNLPNPADLIALAGQLPNPLDLLPNLALPVSLIAQIDGLQARIAAKLEIIADLQAQLAVSGLGVWSYSGAAGGLGEAFEAATAAGLPGAEGPASAAYGLVLACAIPSAWAAFSAVTTGGTA